MAFSTKESPIYGGGFLVVEFGEDTPLSSLCSYYVIYEASKQRHVTTAKLLSPTKLQSIIPGHTQAEEVHVSIIDFQGQEKTILATSQLVFLHDGVFYLAQFLLDSVCSASALEDLELIKSEHFNLADEEFSTLDTRLNRALLFVKFPDWWTILGEESQSEHPEPRESLLHFCARLGLTRVATLLLHKPGSEAALKLHNHKGHLPRDVALDNGHNGLAELLSEYNIHSLASLGQCIETEKGVVQTQETGDITLTSDLQNHNRSIEEDIIVLQGVQCQLDRDDVNISRVWQTDWPAHTSHSKDTTTEEVDTSDETYKSICEKAKELPALVSVDDHPDVSDTYSDPNLDSKHQTDDDVDISEDCDIDTETDQLSHLHISEGDDKMEDIMEGSISSLHEYNEQLHRIREKSTVFNRILEQDIRKDNLARFSSSCPSLDVDCRNSPLPVIDEGDLCKSMVDLADDNAPDNAAASTSSLYSGGDAFSSGPDIADTADGVHIVVDRASVGSSSEFGLQTQEYDNFLQEYYGGNQPQVRQRSFSPQPVRHHSEKDYTDKPSMLIHGNKSSTLMPGEEDTDDDSFRSREDVSGSDSNLSTGHDSYRRPVRSTGDIDNQSNNQLRNKDGSQSTGARGQVNTARYSADIEQMMRDSKERHSGTSLDQMSQSTHDTIDSGTDKRTLLGMPDRKITKALSMSSIPAATNGDKNRGSSYKDKHAQLHRQDEIEEEDPTYGGYPDMRSSPTTRKKPQLSLYDFLTDPTNFTNDTSNVSSQKPPKDKDEKKRKTSVFSRFHSSYRIKKNKDKEGKSKSSSHRFVSVSFSNATTCDVCHKLLTNKPALRCQICLVNVHENSCKEHITACDKFKSKSHVPRQSSAESEFIPTGQDRNSAPGVSNLRPSYSFKDNTTRPHSAYTGALTTPVPITTAPIQPEVQQLQTASAQLQRRSLPTPSRAIAEEGENDHSSRLDLGHNSSFADASNICHSTESLDEVDSVVQEVRFDDVELGNLDVEEPETWSETVDKKVIKKMAQKEVKRQDTIWELIQTERLYCKRLKTLEIMYRDGMLSDLHMPRNIVERMFPHLDDLIYIHMGFLRQLQDLQNLRTDRLIEEIGPTLNDQFSGGSSDQMKESYGVFCSGHLEAVQIYKDLLAKDRKFQQFIRSRSYHPLCRKREIPDFILLITQRLTKYPTLIEAIIKRTTDKRDREILGHALGRIEEVLQDVDTQVAAAERAMKLRDICNRLESRSFAIHRGKKFKKSDILNGSRRLLHEGVIGWKNARGKSAEVIAVVLTDVLFFLQDNGQKYSFFSQDNKHGVVSLFNLLVREKRDTRDTKGIYLISQNKQNPEMYEVVFNTAADMQRWAKVLRVAVENCPEEEEEVPTEADEDRRKLEDRYNKAQEIMERLQQKDEEIRKCCEVKNSLMMELLAVYNDTEEQQQLSRPSSRDFDDIVPTNSAQLQAAINEVSSQLTTMLHGNTTNLSRSVSSVGEHSSNTFTAVPMPKRAETFAGFDNNHDHKVPVVKKGSGVDQGDSSSLESPQTSMYKDKDASDSELSQYTDIPSSIPKGYDSESESGRGSSPSCNSGATMSPMSSVSLVSHDHTNIAHLLKTLNKIVHLTSSQGTAVETLRAQLYEANERINKLSADVHEKKSGYRHNQLEELRNLQGVIQKEKEDWELKKAREKYAMEQEKLQLEELKRNLDKQELEIKQQKEKFNKEREVLQRQMDMLRRSGQLPRDNTSLSDLAQSDNAMDKEQPTSTFVPGHKRSASAESFGSTNDESSKKTGSSAPPKENNFRPEHKSVSKLQSFSFGSNKQNLPVHLLSATNEQKIGSKNVQQLPSKLLSGGNSVSSPPQQTTQTGLKTSAAGNQSSPSLVNESSAHGSQGHMGHSVSAGHLGNQPVGQNQYGSSVTVPKGSYQSNRPKPTGKAGLSGVLKLAEKGDKKSKSGSSSHSAEKGAQSSPPNNETPSSSQQRPKSGTAANRNANVNHKPQKSDSDVIYF